MNNQLIPVPFYSDTVVLVERQNQPYVAMKPIVNNLGLNWKSQYEKLSAKFSSTISIIETVGEDGKNREMVCLPLRKLPAWLYSINPGKVAPELRDAIIRYQEECDEALWNYWTQGIAVRTGAVSISQQLAAHHLRLKLLDRLLAEKHPACRIAIHQQLDHVSRLIGIPTPAIDTLGAEEKESPVIASFWALFDYLELNSEYGVNHAREGSGEIAVNLNQLVETATACNQELPCSLNELRRLLKGNTVRKFLRIGPVRSAVSERHARGRGPKQRMPETFRCWIFRA